MQRYSFFLIATFLEEQLLQDLHFAASNLHKKNYRTKQVSDELYIVKLMPSSKFAFRNG